MIKCLVDNIVLDVDSKKIYRLDTNDYTLTKLYRLDTNDYTLTKLLAAIRYNYIKDGILYRYNINKKLVASVTKPILIKDKTPYMKYIL